MSDELFPFGGEAMRSGKNVRVGLMLAVLLVGAGTASSAEPLSVSGGASARVLNPTEPAWASPAPAAGGGAARAGRPSRCPYREEPRAASSIPSSRPGPGSPRWPRERSRPGRERREAVVIRELLRKTSME